MSDIHSTFTDSRICHECGGRLEEDEQRVCARCFDLIKRANRVTYAGEDEIDPSACPAAREGCKPQDLWWSGRPRVLVRLDWFGTVPATLLNTKGRLAYVEIAGEHAAAGTSWRTWIEEERVTFNPTDKREG